MKKKIPKQSEYIDGLTRVAVAIADKFKISCTKQSIKNWQKWTPGFPSPAISGSNRYNRAECFDWIEKNYLSRGASGAAQTDLFIMSAEAEARIKIRKDEESALDIEIKRGRYIPRDTSKRTIIGALKKYHSFVRSELERGATTARREKLTLLGASPEIVAAFYEFDFEHSRLQIDRIEQRCAREATEATKEPSAN